VPQVGLLSFCVVKVLMAENHFPVTADTAVCIFSAATDWARVGLGWSGKIRSEFPPSGVGCVHDKVLTASVSVNPKTAAFDFPIYGSGFLAFIVIVKSLKQNKTKSMGDFCCSPLHCPFRGTPSRVR
jgi:hypothetical protein